MEHPFLNPNGKKIAVAKLARLDKYRVTVIPPSMA